MARNRRLGFTPPTKSLREKANEVLEKEQSARAKCRASIKNTNMCQDCSQSAICSSEATQEWMKDTGEGEKEDYPSEAVKAPS